MGVFGKQRLFPVRCCEDRLLLNSKSKNDIYLAGSYSAQGDSLVAQTVKRLPAMRETQVQSLGREDPLEKEMQSTSVLLPRQFHG